MTKRKLGEETPTQEQPQPHLQSPLFSPGLTERQQIALAMKLSGESSHNDSFSTPRPAKIFKTNKHGESPLQIAAIKGDIKQVKFLIRQGADVNTRDHAGWSPLHEASQKGYLEVCKFLLKHGAHVNAHGYQDETPLHDATLNSHPKIVSLLLSHGANPLLKNKGGKIPIEVTEKEETKQLLRVAASNFAIDVKPPEEEEDSDPLANYHTPEQSEERNDTSKKPEKTPVKRNPIKQPIKLLKDELEEQCKSEPEPLLGETPTTSQDTVFTSPPTLDETEDAAAQEADNIPPEEIDPSPYYRYSYLMPEPACSSSIVQNGPITLYVARNKRPVKRAPMLESRSPPATRSRAGGKPVDNTEAEELRSLNEGRHLLKSAVVTPRKKWLHQHTIRKRHMGDIYDGQKRCVPAEPSLPNWITSSMLYTKKYLLQNSVVGKLDDEGQHPYAQYLPPVMGVELDRMRKENAKLSCKHEADKERLLQQHEQSMLRARRQAIMKHPSPSVCSVMLQQQNFEYSKKLQTVAYDVNNDQLLLVMGEKVMKNFDVLSERLYNRQKQESDTQWVSQRFSWVNNVHKYGLYDMPILGNIDTWIERVDVSRLKPLVEYYDEYDPSDSEDSNR